VVRAVVFDFDGVLANSEPLHFKAFQGTLAEQNVGLTQQDYYGRYLGYDDAGVFRALSHDRRLSWTDATVAELVERKAARLELLERETSVLFPGADAVVRRLAGDFPLAIASGALRAEIVRVLEGAALSHCFVALVAAEDTPASKPAPDPYLRAVALLQLATGSSLSPGDCVAVEDSRWGLESARSAGLHTIAVTHTYPAEALTEADLIISSLDALDRHNLDKIGAR
jgi:beta-phosphoglucomutase